MIGFRCNQCQQVIDISSEFVHTTDGKPIIECPRCKSIWIIHDITVKVEYLGQAGETND